MSPDTANLVPEPATGDGARRSAGGVGPSWLAILRGTPLAELHGYWDRLRGVRPVPRRAHLDPAELRALLPCLALADIALVPGAPGGCAVTFRLAGTRIEHHYGTSLSGRTLDELFPARYAAALGRLYAQLAATAAPVLAETSYQLDEGEVICQRLLLPLAREEAGVSMALTGQIFASDLPDALLRRRSLNPAHLNGATHRLFA